MVYFLKENVMCFTALRYSQFDSHLDGTLDHVFDFNKVAVFKHILAIISHFRRIFLFIVYH